MSAGAFFDTNILVYAALRSDPRPDRARALLAQGGTISVQVLNEFANVARAKLRKSAIRALSGRSVAIDLYIWLAYRLHHLARPTRVPWPALYRQFGAGFAQPRQFRAHAREALALALAAYPEARVGVEEGALTLMPSPAPVPERHRPGGRKAVALA